MISIVKKIFRGFIYSLHGLYTAYTREQSIRVEVWGGLFLVVVAYAAWPLAVYEILFLVLGYIMILAMELINTSIETVWEKYTPNFTNLLEPVKILLQRQFCWL